MSWKDRESDIWQLYRMGGGFAQLNLKYNISMMSNKSASDAQDYRAVGYMLVAILCYSITPIFFHVGEAHQAPVAFNAVRLLGAAIGMILFLLVFYHKEMFDIQIWRAVWKHLWRWSMLGIIVGVFNNAVYAWSLKHIDISISIIVYESWTILMIILMGRMFKGENRYGYIKPSGWAFALVGYAGLGLVILSQSGEADVKGTGNYFWFGLAAALFAAGMGALLNACSIRWGVTVRKYYYPQENDDENKRLELFFGMMGLIIAGIPNMIIAVTWGHLGLHHEKVEADNMMVAFLYGLLIMVVARVFYKKANLRTTNLQINALFYVLPMLSLVWLWIPGYINVIQLDWLIIGAIGVVAANALLNFQAEQRLAYQALMIALWFCGAVVYLRPIWNAPVFYESMTLVATLFILILSFRIDRLVRRTSEEDKITMDIMQQISLFPKNRQNMQNKLRDIDEADSPKKLKDAYDTFKRTLEEEHPEKASPESDKEIATLMRKVNNLAHSKQQGANFGEQAVLWILGGICAGGLLAFMPQDVTVTSGTGGFFLEMAAFLIAATVIFLLFNIQDLQGDRSRQMIERESDTGTSRAFAGIVFREIHNRATEKWLSIAFCAIIVTTFVILLWHKWIPA